MTKNYQFELEGMNIGLLQLEKIIFECKDRFRVQKAIREREIQHERIKFLKIGYSLRDGEFMAQEKLKLKDKINRATILKNIELNEQMKLKIEAKK